MSHLNSLGGVGTKFYLLLGRCLSSFLSIADCVVNPIFQSCSWEFLSNSVRGLSGSHGPGVFQCQPVFY
jgi:hypothetical protein